MAFDLRHPPERLLLGPGPSLVSQRVRAAMARPTVGHLDPFFLELMDDLQSLLRRLFHTENKLTLPISAPGSAGMEACLVNLVEPGDKVVVCRNGVFGLRMSQIVEKIGGKLVPLDFAWGEAVSPDFLEECLKKNQDTKLVAFVHAETSTGALSDAEKLSQIAKKYQCLTVADAVTSLGGVELRVDDWQIDAIYSGSQKCLSAPPGLSPVSFSEAALDKIKSRSTPIPSWFLDLNLIIGYWDEKQATRSYHHTAPINNLYGLHESLVSYFEEGEAQVHARHLNVHQYLVESMKKLQLELAIPDSICLPQLNPIRIPASVSDAQVRQSLLQDFNIEIGAGLGELAGKVWRIGLMGSSADRAHVDTLCQALGQILS